MEISDIEKEDLEQILTLQKLCFYEHAEFYNDFEMAPMTQTLQDLEFDFKNFVFIKASVGTKIVGSVRASEKDRTCFIGRLIVHPDYQNQGIGKKLMSEIENRFKHIQRFELFTGYKDEKNLYLYRKLGYNQFKIQQTETGYSLVYLEKPNNSFQN
jgi:ribosomal protein S18 acetylase RimI-like enzyme